MISSFSRICSLFACAAIAACTNSASTNSSNTVTPPNTTANGGETTAATVSDDAPVVTADAAATAVAPEMGHVRLLNASPDPHAAMLTLAPRTGSPVVSGVGYKSAQPWAEVAQGAFQGTITGDAPNSPLTAGSLFTTSDGPYLTLFAYGLSGPGGGFATTALADRPAGPAPDGTARVRFFHALVGVAAVDVCVPGATARAAATVVWANTGFGRRGQAADDTYGYASVPAGAEVTLQVRAANEARPCTGAVAGVVRVTPPAHGVLTAIAVGRASGTPAAARELLLCNDDHTAAPSCNAVAIAAR